MCSDLVVVLTCGSLMTDDAEDFACAFGHLLAGISDLLFPGGS